MLNIDYKVNCQDDIDAQQTDTEYRFNQGWGKWIIIGIKVGSIIFGGYCIIDGIIERNDPNIGWLVFGAIISMISLMTWSYISNPKSAQSNFMSNGVKQRWDKKDKSEEYRNIILTETEIIFKTETSESSWKWKAVKKYFEGEKSFIIWFYSDEYISIPKRIFTTYEILNGFKNILAKYTSIKNK